MVSKTSTTLKDIADAMGISITSVHRALYNKQGVGKELQKKITEMAISMNYSVNVAASSLRKSDDTNIAVLLPKPENDNQYFFHYLWQGLEEMEPELHLRKVSIVPYLTDYTIESTINVLEKILADEENLPDGIICNQWNNVRLQELLHAFFSRNIPVYVINSETKLHESLCFYNPSKMDTGMIAYDIIHAIYKENLKRIILLAGERENSFQVYTISNFEQAIRKQYPEASILEIHEFRDIPKMKETLEEYLTIFPDIQAIFSITARETMGMCASIEKLGLSGKLTTVGVDLFPELLPYFENETLTASIYQYPKLQIQNGVRMLLSCIFGETISAQKAFSTPIAAVFKSNAGYFC